MPCCSKGQKTDTLLLNDRTGSIEKNRKTLIEEYTDIIHWISLDQCDLEVEDDTTLGY